MARVYMLNKALYLHFTYLVKTCSMNCECKALRDCKWAAEILDQGLDTSKIMKNICEIPITGVCCCGPEQEPPKEKVRIMKNHEIFKPAKKKFPSSFRALIRGSKNHGYQLTGLPTDEICNDDNQFDFVHSR